MNKTKILMISDHALTPSGVGVQSKFLIEGLIKTGKYEFIQLGAAKYHEDMSPQKINEDLTIIPSVGFGNKDILRSLLASEKPDAIIIFTDSRFFTYLFNMEDEIHEVCPIIWWHVWDNKPVPRFSKKLYDSVDQINCISRLTYQICQDLCKEKATYIPHSFPKNVFYEMNSKEIKNYRSQILKEKSDWFLGLWINRNFRRKRPSDVLKSWQIFLENLNDSFGHKKALLIMHTDPLDPDGTNLIEVAKELNVTKNIRFSQQELSFEEINVLHNISDFCLNISFAEGFGLSTLQSLYTGTPIIVNTTGGLTSQIINQETLDKTGIALTPEVTTISGNLDIPYLNEDYVSVSKTSREIMNYYTMSDKIKNEFKQAALNHVNNEFNYEKMINDWDLSIEKTIDKFKNNAYSNRIRLETF
jgi:glycosyltransferase involved in cell wall biosynthesis